MIFSAQFRPTDVASVRAHRSTFAVADGAPKQTHSFLSLRLANGDDVTLTNGSEGTTDLWLLLRSMQEALAAIDPDLGDLSDYETSPTSTPPETPEHIEGGEAA